MSSLPSVVVLGHSSLVACSVQYLRRIGGQEFRQKPPKPVSSTITKLVSVQAPAPISAPTAPQFHLQLQFQLQLLGLPLLRLSFLLLCLAFLSQQSPPHLCPLTVSSPQLEAVDLPSAVPVADEEVSTSGPTVCSLSAPGDVPPLTGSLGGCFLFVAIRFVGTIV